MTEKNKNKQETIDMICDYCDMVDSSKEASSRYRRVLEPMSDTQFHEFMLSLKNGEDVLYVNIPNLKKKTVTFENNVKVAKKLGIDFFKHLVIVDPKTGTKFTTPKKYAILDLPVRRQIQTISSGFSVADDHNKIDPTTGQVVGGSQAASLSTPETFILYAKGLNNSIVELTKIRGGDTDALRHTYRKLENTGHATIGEAMDLGTRATSTDTLNAYFTAIHIDSNL